MNKQSFITILLTMLMSMTGTKAFAHDIEVANANNVTIYYNWINNKTELAVSYRGSRSNSFNNEYTGNVVIPGSVEYDGNTYTVTSIGESAFSSCSGLASVTIPNSVSSIDNYAFSDCSGLNYINIPNSVTTIGNSAFANCSAMASVTIPNSVTSIGESAFINCNNLTTVNIPNSVTTIGIKTFLSCSNLTSITIPNSVTTIGDNAFTYCSNLTSITIPNSVTSIGFNAFYGTAWYNNQTDGLIYAGKVVYKYKGTIPSNTELELQEGTLGIAGNAFSDCSGLTSVTLPSSVTSIGYKAFYNCSGLNSVHISDIKDWCEIAFNGDYSNPLEYAHHLYQNGEEINDLIIPNSVTSIGDHVFYGCSAMTSVTIPNSVTSIGNYAFNGCSGLTTVTIPNSVTSIGESAFSNCFGLTSVTIPNSVTSIGESAFEGCIGLTSVTIPNSMTSIGDYAFSSCSGLTTIVSEIKTPFEIGNIANTSVTLIVPVGTKATYQSATGWTNFTNTVEVGEGGFAGCQFEIDGICYTIGENNKASLTSTNKSISGTFEIPSQVELNGKNYDVTSIGQSAFYDRRALTSITIPNSVTSIGNQAFRSCRSLTSVIIGCGVLSIGLDAFDNTNLKKTIWLTNAPPSGCIYAKGAVNYVSSDQFNIDNKVVYKYLSSNFVVDGIRYVPVDLSDRTCDAIDCIYEESAKIINIGETVTNEGVTLTVKKVNPYTCYGNKHIKNVKLSLDGDIGEYAFSECRGLNVATVNNYGSIGNSAFSPCNELSSVIIGSSVLSIGDNAFEKYGNTKTIWLRNTLPLGYNNTHSIVNYVSNDQFDINNKVVYKYLSSTFVVDGIRYVPVSISDRTCDVIDCVYDESSENINIGETVTDKNITFTVMKVNPYSCIGNQYIKTISLDFEGSIGDWAFSFCQAVENVELGQKITSIGNSAFDTCRKLKKFVIPDAVESVSTGTFFNCSSLEFLKIGSGVKTINHSAFSGCTALPAITIPQGVTTIDNNVFLNCTSLAKVTIADSETTLSLGSNGSSPIFSSCPLDYVYIGRDISYKTSINYGYSPFNSNTELREVIITDKETEITDKEFSGCTNLQTVTIGDGVTTIGTWAFSGCSSLKYFTFGSRLENIGQKAFSNCTDLVQITSKAKSAPACGSQALEDINKWECILNVPKGYLAVYKAADQWKDFFFMEEGEYIPPLKGDVNSDGKVDKDDLRDLVEYIMGNNPNGVTDESADVNGDNKVNVADVVALTSLQK